MYYRHSVSLKQFWDVQKNFIDNCAEHGIVYWHLPLIEGQKLPIKVQGKNSYRYLFWEETYMSSLFSQQALSYYRESGQRTVILKSTVPCLILGYIPYVGSSSNTYTKNYNNPQRKLLFKQFFGRLLILHTVNVMHFFTISTIDCNG